MRSNRQMLCRVLPLALCLSLAFGVARAQETIHVEGDVPEGPNTFFFLDFEVPEGIVEIEVAHVHVPEDTGNVLDWGIDDPNGSRGWGGSNQENAIVGIEAASRSYIPGPMPAGTWRVTVGKAKIVPGEPAGYSVDVTLRTIATQEPQSRKPYQDPGALKNGARWYAGDFHVHTRESGDARFTLTIDEALDFAEGQGLDFVMLSEHNTNSGLTLYADAQAGHPDILIFPGQEFTTYRGHGNALGALDNVDYTIDTDGYTIAQAIDAFHAQGALFSINHPSNPLPDCRGCAWTLEVDPTTIDGVEVQTLILPGVEFWEDLCANGSHATAIAGSDDHRAGQDLGTFDTPIGTPTTMVFASELSVDAIFEGVQSGRTVVKVLGPNSPMIETELSGKRVGNTVFADHATLSVVVTGADGMSLRVIKNGDVLEVVQVSGDRFEHETAVEAPPDGEDRYRHELVKGAQRQSLSSYVWLRKADDAPGGGGCDCRTPGAEWSDGALLFSIFFLCGWWLLRHRAAGRS